MDWQWRYHLLPDIAAYIQESHIDLELGLNISRAAPIASDSNQCSQYRSPVPPIQGHVALRFHEHEGLTPVCKP